MQVTVILGSSSDMPVAEKCTAILGKLGISYEIRVASAHRSPSLVRGIVEGSKAEVIIAIAGMAAALPGVAASYTTKPVIGVPVGASLGGLDALLSIAQLPPGIPAAAVGIGQGENAALLAAEIMALSDSGLAQKLASYRKGLAEKVRKQDEGLRK